MSITNVCKEKKSSSLEESILKRVAVRPPYYALKNLKIVNKSTLEAEILKQQRLGMECSPITAAEASRHLAILGTCAIEFVNEKTEGMKFYLAYKAHYKRVNNIIKSNSTKFVGVAKANLINKRHAIAKTEIRTETGEVVSSLEINYFIFPEKIFKRHYSSYKKDMRLLPREKKKYSIEELKKLQNKRRNLYKRKFPVENYIITDNEIVLSMGELLSEHCMGHFPLYPALPVAVLCNQQMLTAGLWLKNYLGAGVKYFVKEGKVDANNLAFAGDNINISAKLLKIVDNKYIFNCSADTECGKKIGTLHLILEVTN